MIHKGRFKPKNWQKYKGDPTNIIYRSGLELRFMSYFDRNNDILSWSSEETVVGYRDPITNRLRRYFPDFVIKAKLANGSVETFMIEVKPYSQTRPPKPSQNRRRMISEGTTWAVNNAKWEAATQYCLDRGWKFKIMTEKDVNGYP